MRKLIYKFTLYAKLIIRKLARRKIPVVYVSKNDAEPEIFSRLYKENSPVYIIRNFIDPGKIPAILQALKSRQPDMVEKDTFGYCYGQNLMTARTLEDYLGSEPAFTNYLRGISLDYDRLIGDRIAPLSSCLVERMHYDTELYFPCTIRFLQPGKGGIRPHTELLHYELFETCRHLAGMLNLENEISAFCVLQKPDSGGRLRIYHCTFTETQHIPYPDLRYDFVLQSGYTDLDPDTGDLVLFGGGQRWHAITEIKGQNDRITIGNFFCFNRENDRVYYWS